MSSDTPESLSDVWSARFDDRDDEDLSWHRWSQRLTMRDKAMAQPIKDFAMPEGPERNLRDAANDAKPS